MSYLVIGNILSAVTACFTILSSWTKSPTKTYAYQVAQCLVYAVASYFFGVYSCIIMMLINSARNYLVATQKYNKYFCMIFCVLSLVLGLAFNQRGYLGILVIAATIQYTFCSYILKKDIAVKVNVIINLTMYVIYDFMIKDLFSFAVDFISTVLAVITIYRILMDKKSIDQKIIEQ